MEEREQEIKVHTDVLKAQLKAAEEERHSTAKMLTDKLLKVERLNNKYDIVCGKMGGDEGQGEGEHTQAYYVIKAAQEREELQRQGDDLDLQIQKAEREIRALEKTLEHLFSKNAGYKRSVTPAESSTPAFEQKLLLDEQHRAALSKYRTHRLEQSELEEEMLRQQDMMAQLAQQRDALSGRLIELSDTSAALKDTLQMAAGRLERKRAEVGQLLEAHRADAQVGEGEHTNLELEVSVLKQQAANRALVGGLAQLAGGDQQLADAVEKKLAEAGVHPPAQDPFDDGAELEEEEDDDLLE